MTPREKAGGMFDKYYNPLINLTTDIDYQNYLYKKDLCIQHAKKCALIAVDEIIEATSIKYEFRDAELFYAGKKPMQYWLDVKQEIEAL